MTASPCCPPPRTTCRTGRGCGHEHPGPFPRPLAHLQPQQRQRCLRPGRGRPERHHRGTRLQRPSRAAARLQPANMGSLHQPRGKWRRQHFLKGQTARSGCGTSPTRPAPPGSAASDRPPPPVSTRWRSARTSGPWPHLEPTPVGTASWLLHAQLRLDVVSRRQLRPPLCESHTATTAKWDLRRGSGTGIFRPGRNGGH